MSEAGAAPQDSLRDLAGLLRAFAQARNWEQYTHPRTSRWPWPGGGGTCRLLPVAHPKRIGPHHAQRHHRRQR
jgi:hypothetical protein